MQTAWPVLPHRAEVQNLGSWSFSYSRWT